MQYAPANATPIRPLAITRTEKNITVNSTFGGEVSVTYRVSDTTTVKQDVIQSGSIDFDLTPNFDERIVPGSVRFGLGSREYIDRNGSLFYNIDPTTGAGTFGGTINYSTGKVNITDWEPGINNTITVKSLTTTLADFSVSTMTFRIPQAPVKSQSLQIRVNTIDGTLLTATADVNGKLSAPLIDGYIDTQFGMVTMRFGQYVNKTGNEGEPWYTVDNIHPTDPTLVWKPELVLADTMLYNATVQTFLPLDSSILGLNPVRLPEDGRIPVYKDGDVVVILHDQITTGTFTSGTQTDLGRGRLAKVIIRDSVGAEIIDTAYTVNLDTGIIDWIDLTGISQPLEITDRIEDMAIVTDVQITGKLSLSQPLTHNFPATETLVSNAVIYGDLFAHTSIPFDQKTWTGQWSDTLIGDETTAQYNNSQYPFIVDNAACIQERWAFIFTSSTTVNVVGENVGQILSGADITTDIAPINPNTGTPYFTVPAAGWGSGWAAGNVLRINTYAANAPTWIIQSIGQGDATDPDFNFCIEQRGDINTP